MDLKPQEPAEGITKTAQYPGYESYQVPCICGNPDDTIEFTVENDDCEVTVSTYTLQRTPWWEDPFKRHSSFSINNELLYQINYYVRGFLTLSVTVLKSLGMFGYMAMLNIVKLLL